MSADWFYFEGFLIDHRYIQLDVLMTIFDEQTQEEKEQDKRVQHFKRGFLTEHIRRLNPLARKVRQSRLKSEPLELTAAEKENLRLLGRYFERYFQTVEERKLPVWRMLISDLVEYSDRCWKFEEAILVAISWRPDLKVELNDLSRSLRTGRPLSDAERIYERMVGFKAIEDEEEF